MDRFLAVHLHFRYKEIVTPQRVVSILILFWVISATMSLLGVAKHYNSVRLIFVSIFVPVCLITIALLQCKIYSVVRRHRYQIRDQQAQGSVKNNSRRGTFERQNLQFAAHSSYTFCFEFAICHTCSLTLLSLNLKKKLSIDIPQRFYFSTLVKPVDLLLEV